MSGRDLPGLIVAGTDTDVGKTFITASILRALRHAGLRPGAMKPVATGVRPGDMAVLEGDAAALMAALGPVPDLTIERIAPVVFEEPLAPPVAARLAGTPLHHRDIQARVLEAEAWWAGRSDLLLVEGIGGFLCPLAEDSTFADLAIDLGYPLVIVGRLGLGTLNHTLLTVEAATRRGLHVAGVVLCQATDEAPGLSHWTNPAELARWLGEIPILAVVPHQPEGSDVAESILGVDWAALANPPRRLP